MRWRIKPLEDMTFGQRFLLTLIIVLVILFALAFVGWISGRWDEAPAAIKAECIDPELQQKIRGLAQDGFDHAFMHRAELLFDNWTKDDPRAHPQRHQVGMDNAIHAYVYARELAASWSAPPCAAKPVGVQ